MKTNLQLVDETDNFPYADTKKEAQSTLLSSLYTLIHTNGTTTTPIGYITPAVLTQLTSLPQTLTGPVEIHHASRTITAFNQPTEAARSAAIAAVCAHWRANHTFAVLSGWRNELYPVYAPDGSLLFNVERAASPLFGTLSFGIHLTAYVRDASARHGIRIWIPRRASSKSTYPSMLDNTVAGGLATGEDPVEGMVRESGEEASLPEDYVRATVVPAGSITYIYVRGENAGGETGLIQPELQYVYDLELPAGMAPKPNDSEVEGFYLWDVDEVQRRMANGEFKPNCALTLVDFFVRWGILTRENEGDFEEIRTRLHRRLDFPMGPHGR